MFKSTLTVADFRAAIVDAAGLLTDSHEDLSIVLEPSDENDGDLILAFSECLDGVAGVKVRDSLSCALLDLAGQVIEALEDSAEDQRGQFTEGFKSEMRDLQREIDHIPDFSGESAFWEDKLDDIIEIAKNIKGTLLTDYAEFLQNANKEQDVADELRSDAERFKSFLSPMIPASVPAPAPQAPTPVVVAPVAGTQKVDENGEHVQLGTIEGSSVPVIDSDGKVGTFPMAFDSSFVFSDGKMVDPFVKVSDFGKRD